MKTKHYIGIALGLLLLGVMAIFLTADKPLSLHKSKVYFTSGGSATGEEVKTPLKASVIAQQRARRVTFSLQLSDAGGKKIRSLHISTGRSKRPKVEIFNALGERVYACTLEYG